MFNSVEIFTLMLGRQMPFQANLLLYAEKKNKCKGNHPLKTHYIS